MRTALITWLFVRPLGQVASFSIIAVLLSFSAYMWQTISPQLRIIISQKYRQKHRNCKEASHADYEKCAKVLTSIHPLYPMPWICQENKSWQGFQCLWYGWRLYCLGFLRLHKLHHCCISLFRQLDIAINPTLPLAPRFFCCVANMLQISDKQAHNKGIRNYCCPLKLKRA